MESGMSMRNSVVFHRLTLRSANETDGLPPTDGSPRVVAYMPLGTRICFEINHGKYLNDGIYAESAYESHVRTFSSKGIGSRRVVREFGFFQLTLLMSNPIFNDVRKKIYNTLAFLAFADGFLCHDYIYPPYNHASELGLHEYLKKIKSLILCKTDSTWWALANCQKNGTSFLYDRPFNELHKMYELL
jgi:hypothetical protein